MYSDSRHQALSFTLCWAFFVALSDGNWIYQARDQHVCIEKDAEFAWMYDETVALLEDISITTGNAPVTLLRKQGEAAASPQHDRVKFLPNAGITLVNTTLDDKGEYKIEVNFKNESLSLEDSVFLYTYDCPVRSRYENPSVVLAHNGSHLHQSDGLVRVRQEDSATLEVTLLIPRATPPVSANLTIHPPVLKQCVTTVGATTVAEVLATTVEPSLAGPDANSTDVGSLNGTEDARLRRELAKNDSAAAEPAGGTPEPPTPQPPTQAPTAAPTTEDPCAVPLEPMVFTCEGRSDEDYECDITSDLERDGVYTLEVDMEYSGGHPLFKPIRKEIKVQFNGPYPMRRMSLAFILLIAVTVVLAIFLFIMLFLAFAWCVQWCKTCTCCSCRSRNRSSDKQDQELLSHEDAVDGECEKCEETMPLSSAPPTDVVRSKSGSKGSLTASKGSLCEPKTPDRDLDDHGRKPASRRSSGGKRTPIPSPYNQERRRKKYWALRNAWMAANILQQPVKSGDQEPQTPDSMDGHVPV